MTTYALGSRFWNLFWMLVTLIPGILLTSACLALAVPGLVDDRSVGGFIGASIGGFVCLVNSAAMAWRVHVLRISGIGRVEIARAIKTIRFDVREVRQLEGRFHQGYNNEQEWKLHIVWVGGKATLAQFHNVRDFAARIEALNPSVKVTGIWPMGPPEPLNAHPAAGPGRLR